MAHFILYPGGGNKPVLRLGYRDWHWMWARVSNLKIDGSFDIPANRFSYGVTFADPSSPDQTNLSGRWVFERVYFHNCDRGVFKPNGNIGNHFIDCTWFGNNYGVYANNNPGMHSGCDRYSGGHFIRHDLAAVRYADAIYGGGQIIFDGTVFEGNAGFGIFMYYTLDARMLYNAISLRNVWFEDNGRVVVNGVKVNNKITLGGVTYTCTDVYFEGVRSVRIDDSTVDRMQLVSSSVNMFNCRQYGVFQSDNTYPIIEVDEKSSLVAYEHRYFSPMSDKIFVNSIAYDASGDFWSSFEPTSVWGPLRVVSPSSPFATISNHFDTVSEPFDDYQFPYAYALNSVVISNMRVLGSGASTIHLNKFKWIKSRNVVGVINNNKPRYCVWSIHTFLTTANVPEGQLYGHIISEDGGKQLGNIHFKYGQWACSYGMKLIDRTSEPLRMLLCFRTFDTTVDFYITDYQIIMFDDLSSANSFVNSRAFAEWGNRQERMEAQEFVDEQTSMDTQP